MGYRHDDARGRRLSAIANTLSVAGAILALVTAALYLMETFSADGWVPWPRGLVLPTGTLVLLLLGLAVWLHRGAHSLRHDTPSDFLEGEEEARVVDAIRRFESRTSGEIRVHIDHRAAGNPAEHAVGVFEKIGMTRTAERNGVLFFVAARDHRFSVVGDEGIDAKVSPSFWEDVVHAVEAKFADGEFTEGLIEGIDMAGEALSAHFPRRDDDVNELPDDISRDR